MNILYFDTCFSRAYAVYGSENEILHSEIIESNEAGYHSARLISEIRNIFLNNAVKAENLDAIGINIGPGSFTGIRACTITARVLAQQFNIRLIGIPSLEILSYLNSSQLKTAGETAVIMDARRNKFYFGAYKDGREIVSPCLIDKEEAVSILKPYDKVIGCSVSCLYLEENGISCINYENSDENLGIFGMKITQSRLKNNPDNKFNWAEVKPLYIQKPFITMPKERKHVL